MEANELRVGNKLRRKSNGNLCTVNWGIIKDAELSELQDYEPIPLTPEILEKAGFKNEADQFFTNVKALRGGFVELERDVDLYIVLLKQKNEDETWDTVILENLFHLHQLQNLYFALTGEELPIDLT